MTSPVVAAAQLLDFGAILNSVTLIKSCNQRQRGADVMFCPQCGTEYREGFFRCSDCDVPLVDQLPAGSENDHPELVVVRTFSTMIDANLAKSALDSVGIESMVQSDDQGGQSPGLAFSQGVELLVTADDVAAANDVLDIEGLEGRSPELPDAEAPETP